MLPTSRVWWKALRRGRTIAFAALLAMAAVIAGIAAVPTTDGRPVACDPVEKLPSDAGPTEDGAAEEYRRARMMPSPAAAPPPLPPVECSEFTKSATGMLTLLLFTSTFAFRTLEKGSLPRATAPLVLLLVGDRDRARAFCARAAATSTTAGSTFCSLLLPLDAPIRRSALGSLRVREALLLLLLPAVALPAEPSCSRLLSFAFDGTRNTVVAGLAAAFALGLSAAFGLV